MQRATTKLSITLGAASIRMPLPIHSLDRELDN
jgi:hypothetical protein